MEDGVNWKGNKKTAITTADHGITTQVEAGVTAVITATTIGVIVPGDIERTTTATTRPNTAIQVLTTTAGETKTSAWVELLE